MEPVKRGSTIHCSALINNSSLVRIEFCVWRQFTRPRLEIWKGQWNSSGLSNGQWYYECRIVVCRALKDDIYKYNLWQEGGHFQSTEKKVQLFFLAEREIVLVYNSSVKMVRKMGSMNTHMSRHSHGFRFLWRNRCIQLNTMKSMQSKGKQIISAVLPAEDAGYSEWCCTAFGACMCPHVLCVVVF